MTINQFSQAIRHQPFRPFQLILVDGRTFTVDHPELAAIDRRGREVTFYAGDGTQHFIDAGLITELVIASHVESVGAQSTGEGPSAPSGDPA
jgi:hypothetical protein